MDPDHLSVGTKTSRSSSRRWTGRSSTRGENPFRFSARHSDGQLTRFLWISDDSVLSTQKGAFRVNCIDCLDRTNVVQSAFARHVLQTQLRAVALVGGTGDNDLVFNDVWANNGDAISRA